MVNFSKYFYVKLFYNTRICTITGMSIFNNIWNDTNYFTYFTYLLSFHNLHLLLEKVLQIVVGISQNIFYKNTNVFKVSYTLINYIHFG